MQSKLEEADIFIYGKMGPKETNQILVSKVELLKNQPSFSNKIDELEENGGKLWLIRESRVEGLLTVQSISYKKSSSKWKMNTPQRYLLSNDKGWILNNESPGSDLFDAIAMSVGGIVKLTEENTTPHLPGLLNLLSESGYVPDNRINPKAGEETQTTAYTTYVTAPKPKSSPLESTIISLPEGILMALSCPLATKKTGAAKLMKDPVTLVSNGITYERAHLLDEDPTLQEGRDFYPNIKLKTIINYVAANALQPNDYLAKLEKVEEDIQDPIQFVTMKNPVLSPSGYSYEQSSIEQWISSKQIGLPVWGNAQPIPDPVTRLNIRDMPLVPNVNLRLFINAWPDFYEEKRHSCQQSCKNF
ncbi:U-box domain-containing protein [Legionella longbeachae]|uniref:Ubiquitin conjugation factor E4 family domain protein (U-box) n=1 Tax=Legionella longbeachae serogroup 1 (strain NSW150) TaxID=661367 RepID=D3HPG5_LEGLN|nr:U-box domain-containing protein [Legionella longbeachae]VEE01305.1 Ubiquitin conjugation factor E4 family domain protein (U-box) [Legionella oakridgensis]HBD7398259.1 ubiquitin [Legionella pneumophila]ARB92330.1 ubiquitin [Legionella longbeachae]ARM34489.1 ubiquitin [Legionella longbeachae]EEZ96216.1 U-box domain-containing protein [Legionella longbeachae D-4968]